MGSSSPRILPIIDLSTKNLKRGSSSWQLVQNQVRKALEEYGCFEAVYADVSFELHKAVFDGLKDLFDLPLQTKKSNNSSKLFYGYVGQISKVPLYESLGIEEPFDPQQVQSFTNIMWPEGNNTFCENMHSFGVRMTQLEQRVKKMIFQSYGVEEHLKSFQSIEYLLRLNKYKKPEMNEMTLGLHSHTDKTCMTILDTNRVKGLKIQTKDGEWISYSPSADSFIVMLGEALMAWSNGRLHCPIHRVMLIGYDDRYSTAFLSLNKETIHVPEELVDEEHPLQFKPFDQMALLHFVNTEEGQKLQCAVKVYCGV